ncbi:hypothetical protein KKH39_02205 [Patescibacteria group bacterium]|nr:hypothetical protein [Patescibacteria group bacterium]
MGKTFYWLPRIFGILFTLFVSLFVLDVFDGQFSWLALLMHLLPSILLLIVLIVSWKMERLGAALWFILVVVYIVMTWGKIDWSAYLAMALPALVIGVLFLVSNGYGSGFSTTSDISIPKPQFRSKQDANSANKNNDSSAVG